VDQGLADGDVPTDAGISAASAAEPVGGVGEPREAPDLLREGGEGQDGADRAGQPTVDVGVDQLHDARTAGSQVGEVGRPAAVLLAAGNPLSEEILVAVAVDSGDQQACAMTTRPSWLTFSARASAAGDV